MSLPVLEIPEGLSDQKQEQNMLSHGASLARAQRAPVSPDHLCPGIGEKSIEAEAKSAAVWGVARSELYPTLAATALSGVNRAEDYTATRFYRRTIADFQAALDLNYTVFDFGAREGRISAAQAEVLAANFAFNDTHRNVIYRVEHAYYQLLNASGQEEAARANLSKARAVQEAAEERLNPVPHR